MMDNKLLTVIVLTYGHAKFIEKCLNSINSQQTEFPFDVIIANDNSPDDTHEIVERLIKQFNNTKISFKYFRHSKNKGMTHNFIWAISQAKSRYIAYCEGDDYWIDNLKLHKQISFLERNVDVSLCCGGYRDSSGNIVNLHSKLAQEQKIGYFTLDDQLSGWVVKSLTLCFRNNSQLIPFLSQFEFARDIHLNYFLLTRGNGYYFDSEFGFYNIHEGGAVSAKKRAELSAISYNVYEEFNRKVKDKRIDKIFVGNSVLNYILNKNSEVRLVDVIKYLLNPRYFIYVMKIILKK